MARHQLAGLLAVGACAFAGCGDSDPESSRTSSTKKAQAPTALTRFCSATHALNTSLDKVGLRVGAGDVEPDEYADRVAFVEAHGEQLDTMMRTAPAAIAADARLVVRALRAIDGTTHPVAKSEANAAHRRVEAFEQSSCAASS
jgi:hypothetical protein